MTATHNFELLDVFWAYLHYGMCSLFLPAGFGGQGSTRFQKKKFHFCLHQKIQGPCSGTKYGRSTFSVIENYSKGTIGKTIVFVDGNPLSSVGGLCATISCCACIALFLAFVILCCIFCVFCFSGFIRHDYVLYVCSFTNATLDSEEVGSQAGQARDQ